MNPNPDPEGPKTCGSCGSRSGFGSATLLSIFRLEIHSLTGFLDHFSSLINSFRVFLFLTLSCTCFIPSLSLCLFLSLLSHSPLPPPFSSSSPGSDDSICELCCLDRIYLLFYCVETDTRPDSRTINSQGGVHTVHSSLPLTKEKMKHDGFLAPQESMDSTEEMAQAVLCPAC
jgi:hypothetical protein